MNNTYKICFNVTDLGIYGLIPGLKEAMKDELIRVYNLFVDECDSGITDKLNEEFNQLYPNYFEDNNDKEWYDLTEYNKFMADGYQKLIVDDFNKSNISPLLDFYVDPEEVILKGCLKVDHNIAIDFYIK